ncbi:hypothetical protein G7Z17_g12518 [Cylindrodendrum hubeiense]|uniref:Ubiquitin-like domain-containing protein n=1 Tax=Cylindrodendrum hubeiense TaxID=595255 RepID=A0A9P5GY66_9HYPO|nr:hypothetical protein G7Z17_g12518 [Cylindrodendrum hubeiense]
MNPAERDGRGADSEAVPDAEVELARPLGTAVADLEPPIVADLAAVESDVNHEDVDENTHEITDENTHENKDEDTTRQDSETVVWPHSSDPQDEPADEQHDTQQSSKGKEPQRLNFTPPLCESEAGSSQTTPAPAADLSPTSTAGLMHGQPIPWELDPERPAQKLPLRFKDALGRTMLIPWRRAKTWEGMKMTIDSQFMSLEAEGMETMLGNSVVNGRYSLHVSLPLTLEPPKRKSINKGSGNNNAITNNNNNNGGGGSSSNNNSNNNNNSHNNGNDNNESNDRSNNNTPQPDIPSASPMRAMILLPEFWDDLIQPGSAPGWRPGDAASPRSRRVEPGPHAPDGAPTAAAALHQDSWSAGQGEAKDESEFREADEAIVSEARRT